MSADVGPMSAIRGSGGEEALIAADASNRAETEDPKEPIPDRAVRVVQ
jgi:hypothetical protein